MRSAKIAADLIERNKRQKGDEVCPTPLEFLLGVLWDPQKPFEVRMDAAKTAAPYIHPRLQAVAVTNPDDNRLTIVFRDFTAGQVEQQKQAVIEQALNLPTSPPQATGARSASPLIEPEVLEAVLADDEDLDP